MMRRTKYFQARRENTHTAQQRADFHEGCAARRLAPLARVAIFGALRP
jgi:hypothetical protein